MQTAQEDARGDEKVTAAPSGSVAPIRLIVADDEPDVRLMLRVYLERDRSFRVIAEAADGREAVALVKRLRPDQLLLDLWMPGVGGLKALRQIRESGSDTKVIVYSAHLAGVGAATAESLGAAAVISKAVTLNDVKATMLRLARPGEPAAAAT